MRFRHCSGFRHNVPGKIEFSNGTAFMKTFLLFLAIAFGSLLSVPSGSAQTSADISGKWHFVLQTQDGDRTYDPTFTLNGDKVGGKWDNSDVKGTFVDGKLKLEFEVNSTEVGPGTLKLDGQFEKDQLTGAWSFQTYDGKFTATRVK
jgi:hypothetical protein